LADLGECGDRKCGNYRLGEYSDVRPSFLEYCVSHIHRTLPKSTLRQGIVYCSLGSGQLLFDWELLERLTQIEGVRVVKVHLIDKDYGGPSKRDSAVRAQRALAGWFANQEPRTFRSFLSAQDFERWVRRSGEAAHILLDCDAVGARKRIDVANFRRAAMRSGGVCLVLSNPAKRTALVKREADLELIDQHVYRRGAWRLREEVSASRSRSKKRRGKSPGRSRGRRRRQRQEDKVAQAADQACDDEERKPRSRGRGRVWQSRYDSRSRRPHQGVGCKEQPRGRSDSRHPRRVTCCGATTGASRRGCRDRGLSDSRPRERH